MPHLHQRILGTDPPPSFPCSIFSDTCLFSKRNDRRGANDSGDLLEKASRLRKEAKEMETKINRRADAGEFGKLEESITYTSLEDSSWILSYRFASEPPPKDEEEVSTTLKYYSGKMLIRLRTDGYTDFLKHEKISETKEGLKFTKFWGWDVEISREDDRKYLQFSADVLLPPLDPIYSTRETRFYFNALVEENSRTGEIKLCDGTVTIKRDVEPPGGFWGIFNGGGILAQFRYCGEFLCKAERNDKIDQFKTS